MSWLTTVVTHLDYLTGRYEAFPVRDETNRAAVLQVLDEVRRVELKRVHGRSALESAAFVDADIPYELYALKDTRKDQMIGCIRVTKADQIGAIPQSREEYHLDKFPPSLLERTLVFTRLAILREYRKTAASLVLFQRLSEDALSGNTLASLLSCEPGLYGSYLRLGFRPLGGVHQGARGGFRIPMVILHHDAAYIHQVHSPLASQLDRHTGPLPQDALIWFRTLEAREGPIDPGVAFYSDGDANDVHAPLTRGLTERGRAELLLHAMEIKCDPGHVVLSLGDGGRSIGFVVEGAVQAEIGGRAVSVLGEGEMFGEIAVVLDTPRTATIVAVGDGTRVLMLSQTCLDRLTDPADRAQVWRNLAQALATRVRRFHE